MIKEDYFSNIVILSNWIKSHIDDLELHLQIAVKMSDDILNGRDLVAEVVRIKGKFEFAKISLIINSAFFLEAYINAFGYDLKKMEGDASAKKFLESRTPTIEKWKEIFPNEANFLSELKDIFSFRNFVAHAKPILRESDGWKTFYKSTTKSWTSPDAISKYLANSTTGLLLEGPGIDMMDSVINTLNSSVDLVGKKLPEYNQHYEMKILWQPIRGRIVSLLEKLKDNETKYGERFLK